MAGKISIWYLKILDMENAIWKNATSVTYSRKKYVFLSLHQPKPKDQNQIFFVPIFLVVTIQKKEETACPLVFSNCDKNQHKVIRYLVFRF